VKWSKKCDLETKRPTSKEEERKRENKQEKHNKLGVHYKT
jgi:hypothetical protein